MSCDTHSFLLPPVPPTNSFLQVSHLSPPGRTTFETLPSPTTHTPASRHINNSLSVYLYLNSEAKVHPVVNKMLKLAKMISVQQTSLDFRNNNYNLVFLLCSSFLPRETLRTSEIVRCSLEQLG